MSPYILIDEALAGLEHPDCPPGNSILVQQIITRLMSDDLITLEEFNHYCKRLNAIIAGRREAA